jgi:hypothetical protein
LIQENPLPEERNRNLAAAVAMAVIVIATAFVLRSQGRLWTCACGEVYLWAGDVWSAHNSQHFLDPYAFTHVLHGFLFFWTLGVLASRLWPAWQLTLAIFLEAIWEVVENAEFIIERYRTTTISVGYAGDTVLNSAGDILMTGAGFWLARRLGFRLSIVLFFITEFVLLVWIRDGLILNVVMLLYPVEAIKAWQMG